MAPYILSNNTLASSGSARPWSLHDLSNRRSLSTTVVAGTRPTIGQEEPIIMVAVPIANSGVGPLILQPPPTSAVNTVEDHGSSPQMAYLGILAIPIVGGIAIYILMRRKKKQKAAKRPPPAPLSLRSETVRTRPDVESPLPRDRIRAMNSIYRDNEVPLSPTPDYQIFSPRPLSPPHNEHPQLLGDHFVLLPISGSSGPPTPLTNSTTFATEFSSCPPTPCTPGFPVVTLASLSEPVRAEDEDNEEARFTWDFRCKGIMNRNSNVLIEAGVKTSVSTKDKRAGDQVSEYEGTEDTSGATSDYGLSVTNGSVSPDSSVSTVEAEASSVSQEKPIANKDGNTITKPLSSINPDTFPLDFNATGPMTLARSDSRVSTSSGMTVLDLKLDNTSFSNEVIAAISNQSKSLPVKKTGDANSGSNLKDKEVVDPSAKVSNGPKEPKKRPALSKPNHRILAPASPSLKLSATFGSDRTKLSSSLLYPPDATHAPPRSPVTMRSIHRQRAEARLEAGRKRSSSEADIDAMKKACHLQVDENVGVPLKSSEATVTGSHASDTKTETMPKSDSAMLKTYLSVSSLCSI